MRKTRPGIEKYYDSFIYAPSYVKLRKILHKSKLPYYRVPLRFKRTEFLTKLFHKLPLPFSPKAELEISDFEIYPIAESHLDAVWLWCVNDSKIRAYKTFYMALKHIKEYPYFSISMTSPQYFNWIKHYDPTMWEEIKEQVAVNKIDICGGSWIEPALRICSGEALVRQRLYGQLFYLRNFGKISKVESLLDVFGFPYSLPQILVKSGAESFWTTKILWNDYSDFPYANFMWRGVDGSEIFTHLFKMQIASIFDYGLYKIMARRPKDDGFVFNSHNTLKEMNDILSNDHVRTLGWFYGKGDGGKGPLFTEIQYMENFIKYYGNFSNKGFKHTNIHRYFEILKEDVGDSRVTFDDELYLEFHRGCLTTHGRVKEGNRNSEELTVAAEFLNTLILLSSEFSEFEYPKRLYDECWQKILFNQFHDILPGSSIPEVYLLTWEEHDFVKNKMKSLLIQRLTDIFNKLETIHGDILLYNPVTVENEVIILDGNSEYYIQNIPPLSILLLNKQELLEINENRKNSIQVESLPSSIRINNDFLTVSISKTTGNLIQLNLKTQHQITNFLYGERNAVSEKTEKFVMKDNTIKTQKLRFRGARINIFSEPMNKSQKYPAWNIDHTYTRHPQKITLVKGPEIFKQENKVSVRSEYRWKDSNYVIIYTIRAQSKTLDVNFKINLKDKKTLIKYFIPLNLHSGDIRCEIPFGSIVRSRNPKSEMEKGKWEFSMQKWIDVSDDDVGFAVLNNSKYGLSANMNGISITLLRSPHYPKDPYHTREIKFDPKERPKYTDIGEHDINLRLVPHKGSWLENHIPHMGIAFNNPVVFIDSNSISSENESISNSKLKTRFYNENGVQGKEIEIPKITSDHSNVIVTTFKPSEWIANDTDKNEMENFYEYEDYTLPENPGEWKWDKKTFIIRAFECGGIKINTPIRLYNIPKHIELSAEETDLLEYQVGRNLEIVRNTANNTVVIQTEFTPYEIKTIRLTMK